MSVSVVCWRPPYSQMSLPLSTLTLTPSLTLDTGQGFPVITREWSDGDATAAALTPIAPGALHMFFAFAPRAACRLLDPVRLSSAASASASVNLNGTAPLPAGVQSERALLAQRPARYAMPAKWNEIWQVQMEHVPPAIIQ